LSRVADGVVCGTGDVEAEVKRIKITTTMDLLDEIDDLMIAAKEIVKKLQTIRRRIRTDVDLEDME